LIDGGELVTMRTIRHPLSGAIYDLLSDGTVQVESRDGRVGLFDSRGRWLSGDLKHADAHLCLWIGGRQLPTRAPKTAKAMNTSGSTEESTP
jgi:hypothetical protein